jgi:hypothetical protein
MNTLEATTAENQRSNRPQNDPSASSFLLTLLVIVTIAAAHSDCPVFWHLISTVPLAGAYALIPFLKTKLGRRRSSSHKMLQNDELLLGRARDRVTMSELSNALC